MFRLIGKLFRTWEIYSMIRGFSLPAYATDKALEYVLNRMRPADWALVGCSVLLLVGWTLEGVNWAIQLVLSILRATGAWHGVWPDSADFVALAHPTFGRIAGWLLCGVLDVIAIFAWLLQFLRRLVPTGWHASQYEGGALHRSAARDGLPPGFTAFAFACLMQLLMWV